jgi:hypothetical protein
MSAGKDRILHICRSLAAKTVANGCTEDEAIAAAAKLAELLAAHNLTMDEVQLRESEFERHTEWHEDDVGQRLWKVAKGAAHMTGSKYWVSRPGVHPVEVNFFGFDHEVAVARYVLEICAHAMRSERDRMARRWALYVPAKRRSLMVAFLDGMSDALLRRLWALKPPAPTGTGLVVLHDSLIVAAMKDAGLGTQDRNERRSRDFERSYKDGVAAGERVALNPGLAGHTNAQRLGR